jgi:hypothetical protein
MAEKLFKYEIGSEVIVNENAKKFMPSYVGRKGVIEATLSAGSYDYEVGFDKSSIGRFKEIELDLPDTLPVIDFSKESDSVSEKSKYNIGDKVLTKTNDHFNDLKGEIKSFTEADGGHVYTVLLDNGGEAYFSENELESLEQIPKIETAETGKFTKIGLEIGQFTDKKNKQYGSSVDATYEMITVLMERYRNGENTYEIPESLLQHILLQVRMMDKINRIFNNPSGKGDPESPYNDLAGYSLIGIDMINKK